jgi:hypothetical protein
MKVIRLWIVIAALIGAVNSTGYCFGLEPKMDFDPADTPGLSRSKLSINSLQEAGSSYSISSLPVIASDRFSLNLSLGYNGDKTSSKPNNYCQEGTPCTSAYSIPMYY